MPFTIKQNDRRPYISGQILQPDNTTPLDLSGADEVNFVMRKQGATGAPFLKGECDLPDATEGLWEYAWLADDTNETGTFDCEIEILWPGAETQTVPVDSYFTVIVVDDLG